MEPELLSAAATEPISVPVHSPPPTYTYKATMSEKRGTSPPRATTVPVHGGGGAGGETAFLQMRKYV